MNVSKSSWHYRFVKRTHDTWLKGFSDLDVEDHNYGWNLCPYLRAVLIWSPLAWIGGVSYTIFIKPFRLLGSWLSNTIYWLIYWRYAKRVYLVEDHSFKVDQWGHKIRKHVKPEKPIGAGPGIFSLIGAWLEARHDQVCPTVKFVDPNEQMNVRGETT